MSVYKSIVSGLNEALEYAKGDTSKAREMTVAVTQTQSSATFGFPNSDTEANAAKSTSNKTFGK